MSSWRAIELPSGVPASICEPIPLPNGAVAQVGVSIGMALVTPTTATQEALLHSADLAMYAAKQAGRCRYGFEPIKEKMTGR